MGGGLIDLSGKRILVTGASSGIGRACVIRAVELGASVVAVGRREAALAETRQLVLASEPDGDNRYVGYPCDLSVEGAVAKLIPETAARGKFDGVVHAAGVGPTMPIGMVDRKFMSDMMAINYFAFMEIMKLFVRTKWRNASFSAVAVSSISALAGWPGISSYAGSKGALSACVRTLAMELAPRGVRVNAVCPANIQTPMLDLVLGDLGDEEVRSAIKQRQPLGIGEPRQVADPVCFLLSDAASFMTGTNIPVDGGYLAQ